MCSLCYRPVFKFSVLQKQCSKCCKNNNNNNNINRDSTKEGTETTDFAHSTEGPNRKYLIMLSQARH